jgi:ribose transport system ATP-binding protein
MPGDDPNRGALTAVGLSKHYGGTVALEGVSVTLPVGTVRALLGGNGSGKSTCVKVLAGVVAGDAGTIERWEITHSAAHYGPAQAHELGLRFVHQALGLFDDLSVAENFALGLGYPTHGGRIAWPALRRRAGELIGRFGINATPDTLVRDLRPATRALVALARTLADEDTNETVPGRSHLLVVDEATAALPRSESAQFLATLRALADAGRGILFISHRIQEVLDVADELTVLRDGRVVLDRSATGLTRPELARLLSGDELIAGTPSPPVRWCGPAHPRLRISGLAAGPLDGVDLDVGRGEIVGVSGLLGSGRTTLLDAIFGAVRPRTGLVEVDGRRLTGEVGAAMSAGVAMIPEDRARHALFPTRSVADNLTEATIRSYWRRGWLSDRRARRHARELITQHNIVAASEHVPITALSGGNQQKVVVARWLTRRPAVLLLDEPTQGVDLPARLAIHETIRAAADGGAAVVLVSSDIDELLVLSTRIVVLGGGRIVGVRSAPFDRAELVELEQTAPTDTTVSDTNPTRPGRQHAHTGTLA